MQEPPQRAPGAGTIPLGEMTLDERTAVDGPGFPGMAHLAVPAAPSPRAGLYYEPADGRPDSAFSMGWLSVAALVGGLITTVLIPATFVVLVGLIALFGGILTMIIDVVSDPVAEEALIEEDIIEARFVQLGVDFEDELPDRVVPIQATALPEVSQVPTEDTPIAEPIERPEEPDSANAIQDVLQRLDDRAELFEEIAEAREREGAADGVEGGTETEASPGDRYAGTLAGFFRRGWTVPTTIARDEVAELSATAVVDIGENLEIVSFSIRTSSGNPIFDQSILDQLTRLQATDQHLPPPPEEIAAEYIGRQRPFRFNGRQAG